MQVPISEKDANKVELRDAILDLAKQPGNEYLKESESLEKKRVKV